MPEQADAAIRSTYADIQATLRVPFVNQVFRLLANNSDCLDAAWRHARPVARTRAFEDAAKMLRAEAALMSAPEGAGSNWRSLGDVDRVCRFSASIQYVLPKLLLVTNLLGAKAAASVASEQPGSAIPYGVAEGAETLGMVDPATAPVRAIFDDILETHGHPVVATYFRSLGQWPELLQEVWAKLRPLIRQQAFETHRDAVIARAAELATSLAPGAAPELPDRYRAMLIAFRQRVIPDLLIEVSMVRAMLEGPEAAAKNSLDIR